MKLVRLFLSCTTLGLFSNGIHELISQCNYCYILVSTIAGRFLDGKTDIAVSEASSLYYLSANRPLRDNHSFIQTLNIKRRWRQS